MERSEGCLSTFLLFLLGVRDLDFKKRLISFTNYEH